MKIQGNGELVKIRTKIDELLNKFASELELVNNEFTPGFKRLKNRRGNIIYYLGLTFFLFIIISFMVFLKAVEALYLILIIYGINLLLSAYGFFLLKRTNKQYKIIKKEWDKGYKNILEYQKEAHKLYELLEIEVYKVVALTIHHDELIKIAGNPQMYDQLLQELIVKERQKIVEELGDSFSSEDVLAYYLEWGKKITNQNGNDYDYMEARSRKAQLGSKNIV